MAESAEMREQPPAPAPEIWTVRWKGGAVLLPDGTPCLPQIGTRPDIEAAHEAVDAWAAEAHILNALPRRHGYSPWWYLRFLLVHVTLSEALPHVRALKAQAEAWEQPPRRIVLQKPPRPWWPVVFRMVFPGAKVHAPPSRGPGILSKAPRLFARLVRAWTTHRRLRRFPPPGSGRPRVLLVQQSRYWNGRQDTLMSPVAEALQERGVDPIVWVQTHHDDARRLRGWRTRPKEHLFGDLLYFQHLLRRGWRPPRPVKLPPAPLMLEGLDVSPLARWLIRTRVGEVVREQEVYLAGLPNILDALNAQIVVLLDENGAEQVLNQAAHCAHRPTVAVQHGCIHPHHLHYMFPQGTPPETIPLCSKTCVHGVFYAGLLTAQSIYPEEAVKVTGTPQVGSAAPEVRPWGMRSSRGDALRKEILDPGQEHLLLFTSQDLFHNLIAGPLLEAFAATPPENVMVIRPHPLEFGGQHWHERIRELGLEARVKVRADGALAGWLDACDVHSSVSSTVLGEAVLAGRPNILMGQRLTGDWMGCIEAGVGVDLDDFPTLEDALNHWIKAGEAARHTFTERQQAYVHQRFHHRDGQAAARIADAVCAIIGAGRDHPHETEG